MTPAATRRRPHRLAPAVRVLGLALGLWAAAPVWAAHGGVYRGPGVTVPPGGAPAVRPTAPGASTPGGSGGDPNAWTAWWGLRRDRFLDLKSAVHSGGTLTGTDAFPLGRGERFDNSNALRPDPVRVRESVVPALLAALENDPSVDMQSACLLALAKIGEHPPGLRLGDVLAARLTSSNQEVAETAALALGISGEERSLFLLAELLQDTASARKRLGKAVPVRTRAFAAYGLGFAGGQSRREDVRRFAVSRLAASLADERFAARDVPVAVLQSMGLIPLALVEGEAEPARPRPASASRAAQVDWLLAILADERLDASLRAHVPGSLGALLEDIEWQPGGRPLKQRAAQALLALIAEFGKASVELRQAAVIGLQAMGDGDGDELDRAIAAELARVALEDDILTRGLAQIALGDSAARTGNGPEQGVGLAPARALLLERLQQGTSLSRPWAAFGLALCERRRLDAGFAPEPSLTQALRRGLEQANSPEERAAMALASGLCRDPGAVAPILARFNGTGADDVRGYFALALGLLRSSAATEALSEAVQRSRYRPGLLLDAATGLALTGDKAAVPLLTRELAQARSLSAHVALTQALGVVGDARAIDPLLALMIDDSKTARARAFAAAALGNVADRHALPFHSDIARRVMWRTAPETLIDPAGGRGLLDLF